MAESFESYRERIASGQNAFLGRLCWYTVPENLVVDHEEIFKILVTSGLGGHVPHAPGDADVFRRVSTGAARKKVATGDPNVFENYLVRDIPAGRSTIIRRVVCEQVDSKNQRLGYEEVAEVSFHKKDSIVHCDHLVNNSPAAQEICEGIHDRYELERGCINGYGVREMIRKVLLVSNATNVRYPSGGVYFVAEEYVSKLNGLEKLNGRIEGVQIHTLPLIDDTRQREMLKRAFEAESVDAIDAMLTEINALKSDNKKISEDRYATYLTALHDLGDKAHEYEALLETGLSSTHSRIKIFQKAVIGLKGQVVR